MTEFAGSAKLMISRISASTNEGSQKSLVCFTEDLVYTGSEFHNQSIAKA